MPKQALQLLHGHTFIYRHCCQSSPKLMWVNFWQIQPFTKLSQPDLDAADFQSIIRCFEGDKQSWIIVNS